MMQFIKGYGVWVVFGLIFVAGVCTYEPLRMQMRREQRAAERIESLNGFVYWYYRYGFYSLDSVNIRAVHMVDLGVTTQASMRRDCDKWVDPAKINDSELDGLKQLAFLEYLDLNGCHVTDSGIAQLQSLQHLVKVDLTDTRTTPEGRAMLRKALPNCEITPDP